MNFIYFSIMNKDQNLTQLQLAIAEFIMNPVNFIWVQQRTRRLLYSIIQENPAFLQYLSPLFVDKTKSEILSILSMKQKKDPTNVVLSDLDSQIATKKQEIEQLNGILNQIKETIRNQNISTNENPDLYISEESEIEEDKQDISVDSPALVGDTKNLIQPQTDAIFIANLDEKLKNTILTYENSNILSWDISDYISFYIKDRDINLELTKYLIKQIALWLSTGKYIWEWSFSSWIFDCINDAMIRLQIAVNNLSAQEKEIIEPRIQEWLSTKELVKKTWLTPVDIKNTLNMVNKKLLKSLVKSEDQKKKPSISTTKETSWEVTTQIPETKEFIDPNMDERIREDFKKFNAILECIWIQLPILDKNKWRKNIWWIVDNYKSILDNEKLDKDILSQLKSKVNARYNIYGAVQTEEWYSEFLNLFIAAIDWVYLKYPKNIKKSR